MLLEWKLQSCPLGSETPTLTHLKHVRKVTGKTPSQLAEYEASSVPESLRYIYNYFLDFYNGDKFRYSELMAWQQYAGIELNYREAELIRQICLERKAYEFKRQQAEIEYMRTKKPKR